MFENFWIDFAVYLVFINIIGFSIMGIDKNRAKKEKWRIRENTLFLVAIIGGSIGSIAGMQVFRYKTKHKQFVYGMPAILIIQIVILVYCILQII